MKQNQATLALAASSHAVCAPACAHTGGQTLPASRKGRRITPLSLLRKITRNTAGATAIEYGLLAGLMAIGLAAGLGALGDVITLLFDNLETETEAVESGLPASSTAP